jgi:RNA polymerase sigma-70 factor (ECF subfamily)
MSEATKAKSVDRAEEAGWIERIARGDERALSLVYDRYSGLLLAMIRKVVGEAEAEDVLQDAFVQVWKQAGRYDTRRSSLSTWLVLIARSRAIDRLRSRQVADRTKEASHRENHRIDESPKGVSTVLETERRERLLGELSELPDEQREVLELAFYEGLTQSEISSHTGIPLGTVKTRTLLAMKKLRRALSSELQDLL